MPLPTSGSSHNQDGSNKPPTNPFASGEQKQFNFSDAPAAPQHVPHSEIPEEYEEEEENQVTDWSSSFPDATLPTEEAEEVDATPPTPANQRAEPTPMPTQGIHPLEQHQVPPTPPSASEVEDDTPDELNALARAYASYPPQIQDSIDLLLDLFSRDDVSEIIMNGPAFVMYKANGERIHEQRINFGKTSTYHAVINQFLLTYTNTEDRIGTTPYRIEGQLELFDLEDAPPVLARVYIIAPPAKENAVVTIAKKSRVSYDIDDIVGTGAMTSNMGEFLKAITRARVTTVISGVSGSGKTTLLEAMTHYFDPNDHVIVVEDTQELRVPSPSTVYLAAITARPGEDKVEGLTLEWLVRATNRMRPERIIVGEINGGEMSEFLIAANSGADGSMTTMHAADPRGALDKMLSFSMKSTGSGNRSEIIVNRDIASIVDLIVQTSLIDGRHVVTAIEEVSNMVAERSGAISTQSLFEYDRNTGTHVVKSNPSTNLRTYMESRGVSYDQSWFQR